MPSIEFLPDGQRLEVAAGLTLHEAAREAGVDLEVPCGGEGTCGRCFVRVVEGEVEGDSVGRLPAPALAEGYVLACRTQLLDSPVKVEIPERLTGEEGQFADDETLRLIEPGLLPTPEEIEPLVARHCLTVPPPQPEDGLSDLDRLSRALRDQTPSAEMPPTLSVLRSVAQALRAEEGRVTVTVSHPTRGPRLVGVEAGDVTHRLLGIAVDVGTTAVAVQLVDLVTGHILETRSDYNAQIPCGVDVISRINYAARPPRLEELRTRVLETINRLIWDASAAHGVNPREIGHAVVSGNTVMTHLLLGLPPEHIRLDPYTPTLLESPELAAAEVGLDTAPGAPVELSPCVGSYVGGDITAGLLCTGLATDSDQTAADLCLFVDIGTNGELVVGSSELLMGCACSAGPAFEGGGIGCGMRGATGAIERVSVDAATARPTCSTIGDAPPRGICGSGMIDLLGNLLRTGWIDRQGRLDRSRASPFVEVEGKSARLVLVPAEESATEEALAITETDIENILRAKAAIYSGTTLMLERLGLDVSDLKRIYVAGSFGRFLDLEQATLTGMLPDVPRERFRYLGNASLTGSYMALISRTHRQRQLALARRLTYIDLSNDPGFMDQYTAALFLPHTDLGRFPSAAGALGTTGP